MLTPGLNRWGQAFLHFGISPPRGFCRLPRRIKALVAVGGRHNGEVSQP
jgi:hypothetical protein